MRTFILVFFVAFAFISCEDVEKNDRALQVVLNNELYRSADARAQINPDGTLALQGFTDLETLTIRLSNTIPGVYTLGGNSPNRIVFEDFEGSVYTTNIYGNGEVILEDATGGLFSGTFKFNAYRYGLDTLNGQIGVFYKVPILAGTIDEDPEVPVSIFTAVIDGANFNATSISSVDSGNFILITGTSGNTTISLSFPNTLTNGNNPIEGNINALITIDGVEQEAVTGNLSIVNHNTQLNSISGAFSFDTADPDAISVTQGQFNVTY